MRAIDSVYEYAGFSLAGLLHEILSGLALPLIVALSGVAWLVHQGCDRGTLRDLLPHVCYLAIAAWLVGPATHQGVSTPRFTTWLGEAADLLQRRAVARVDERFLRAPFEWERIAALTGFARIMDDSLDRSLQQFLGSCARTAIAQEAPRGPNILRPGTLTLEPVCEREREALWRRLRAHVERDPYHRDILSAVTLHGPAQRREFLERYLDAIAARALDDPGSPTSEAALVRHALGEYSSTQWSQSTGGMPRWMKGGNADTVDRADFAVNFLVSTASQLAQDWENRFSAKQRYYLVTTYAPHIYGLSLLMLIGLFPLAGLYALLPGKWRALVNYGKVFMSVKLWPVCWAVLSRFNSRRSPLEVFEPSERGSTDVFLAVSAMYLLAPAVSFLIMHLVTSAAMMPFAPALPPAAGPGLGPVMPAANLALRIAR